jgi:recombinational DNA repair protein RecR
MQKNLIENLSKIISKLPGMGPRIAKRIVLNLAANKEKTLLPLIENLIALNEKNSSLRNLWKSRRGKGLWGLLKS